VVSSKTARYRLDTFTSESLQGNPAGSPVERGIRIYLPPGYFDSATVRYPVVYLLHGYGADVSNPMIDSRRGFRKNYPVWLRVPFRKHLDRILTFERLDSLILSGELPPFILAQPDGSLKLPDIHRSRGLNGRVKSKGSLYTDSRFTGMFGTHIFREVVRCVDQRYRTIAEKSGRSLVGGSMGGYGALLGGILHPDQFQAIAALSPSISCLDLLDLHLLVPYKRILFGRARAEELGRRELEDILDTCDLVFSNDRPLLSSLERDESGAALHMDEAARKNWARSDLGCFLEVLPGAYRDVRLQINCERFDEFGFAGPCGRFHGQLESRDVEHEFEIYTDPVAEKFSPHSLGIAWHLPGALRFCLGR
jgi:hypothetical protein